MGTSIALAIAGSDPGGGAGIQIALKTLFTLGVCGATVVPATAAQSVRAHRHPRPPRLPSGAWRPRSSSASPSASRSPLRRLPLRRRRRARAPAGFLAAVAITTADFVADLAVGDFGPGGPTPVAGQRAVLVCRSRLRPWAAAERLRRCGESDIRAVASGDREREPA